MPTVRVLLAMLRVIALAAVVGCGSTPRPIEEPVAAPRPMKWDGKIAGLRTVAHARPTIDLSFLPDPVSELRWPLPPNVHPLLEPRFAIAEVFAAPGVDWRTLCQRGAQNRVAPSLDPMFVEYLRAWCYVENRDIDLAISGLARVAARSAVLADSARLDIANVLVDAGSADQAQRVLARVWIQPAAIYDVVAATYAEVGKLDDATVFNDLALAMMGTSEQRCRRLVKRIAIEGPLASSTARYELEQMTTVPPRSERTCARLYHAVACWHHPGTACSAYFTDEGMDTRYTSLMTAYERWPRGASTSDQWRAVALDALDAMPLDGADLLATLALEMAVKVSAASPAQLRVLRRDAQRILAEPAHAAGLDARLTAILRSTPDD